MQEGSLLEMIQRLTAWRTQAAVIFLALPVATLLIGWLLRRVSSKTSGWFLSVPIHLTVVPGVGMSMIVAYLTFFARDNLLANYDAVLFLGPIACMVVTLVAARKVQPFDEIPGFDRLGGLMLTVGAAFLAVFLLSRLRVLFFTSFLTLTGLFLVLFVVFKLGVKKLLS